jgi:hypothetical protein
MVFLNRYFVTFVFFVVETIFVVSIHHAERTFQVRDTEIILLVEISQRLHVVG